MPTPSSKRSTSVPPSATSSFNLQTSLLHLFPILHHDLLIHQRQQPPPPSRVANPSAERSFPTNLPLPLPPLPSSPQRPPLSSLRYALSTYTFPRILQKRAPLLPVRSSTSSVIAMNSSVALCTKTPTSFLTISSTRSSKRYNTTNTTRTRT
jgi:hypothetical protein